jgi:hypothetical protein
VLEGQGVKGCRCATAGISACGQACEARASHVFSNNNFSHINMRFLQRIKMVHCRTILDAFAIFPAPFILLYLCIIFFSYVDSEQSPMVLCIA